MEGAAGHVVKGALQLAPYSAKKSSLLHRGAQAVRAQPLRKNYNASVAAVMTALWAASRAEIYRRSLRADFAGGRLYFYGFV